jgi:hypothetical protein
MTRAMNSRGRMSRVILGYLFQPPWLESLIPLQAFLLPYVC